ncbi:CHASE3 domain-containing protein [Parachryseolinea silvisoli]|uniref:CHASE3 domain-containing protein n=1 Tax=Parachryseolinea silvisoli TaxID=2873601 RepID=UPI002265E5C4|nr:CHASE3 domain-containing protein [Parachryseolinea silvisoli]MCD9015119.1 CHASE3 domain-containing protein [Parachryseolinea silvisoli]
MISFKAVLGLLFISLITAIAILGSVCYRDNLEIREAVDWVDHTHRVIGKVDAISAAYKDVQLLKHGRAEPQHGQYKGDDQAERILFTRLNDLKDFTRDNIEQQASIDSLERVIRDWINVDSVLMGSNNKENLRDAVSHRIERIKNTEEVLLGRQDYDSEKWAASFRSTLILLFICIGALLVSTFFAIWYNFNKRVRVQEKLRRSNVFV